jgi:hypothetical protein
MVIYSDSSDYWTGRGWLVVEDEGESALASFETKEEADKYVKDNEAFDLSYLLKIISR